MPRASKADRGHYVGCIHTTTTGSSSRAGIPHYIHVLLFTDGFPYVFLIALEPQIKCKNMRLQSNLHKSNTSQGELYMSVADMT
jgi:hypothetical protein